MRKTEHHWRGKTGKVEGTKFDLSDRRSPAILFLPFTKSDTGIPFAFTEWGKLKTIGEGKGCERFRELVPKLWPRLTFIKNMSNFKVNTHVQYENPITKLQGQKLWYHVKGLVTRNTHVQYKSPIFAWLKALAKVKVFVQAANADTDSRSMTLAPGHSSRLAKKFWPMLKVFLDGQTDRLITIE